MRLGAARNPQDAISIDRPAKNTCGTALLNENSSSHAVFFPIGIPYKKKNTKHISPTTQLLPPKFSGPLTCECFMAWIFPVKRFIPELSALMRWLVVSIFFSAPARGRIFPKYSAAQNWRNNIWQGNEKKGVFFGLLILTDSQTAHLRKFPWWANFGEWFGAYPHTVHGNWIWLVESLERSKLKNKPTPNKYDQRIWEYSSTAIFWEEKNAAEKIRRLPLLEI